MSETTTATPTAAAIHERWEADTPVTGDYLADCVEFAREALAHVGFDRFAAAVSRAFDDVLGVPPENVFIRFGDIGVWSAGCAAFDIARLR